MIEYEIEDFNFVEDGSIEFNGERFTRKNSIGRISSDLFEELVSARQDITNRAASTNKQSAPCCFLCGSKREVKNYYVCKQCAEHK